MNNLIKNTSLFKVNKNSLLYILFSMCGGFMDAFSYINLGGVFANAQTGNLIFMGIAFYNQFYSKSLHYALPVISFAVGIFVSILLENIFLKMTNNKNIYKYMVLLIECFTFLFIPYIAKVNLYLSNILISFVCGMQIESFKEFNGRNINTTMCVGNLRTASKNLSLYLIKGDKIYLTTFLVYFSVIISFVFGGILGSILGGMFNIHGIYFCPFILLITFFIMILNNYDA